LCAWSSVVSLKLSSICTRRLFAEPDRNLSGFEGSKQPAPQSQMAENGA
jgi:hypothetical protein